MKYLGKSIMILMIVSFAILLASGKPALADMYNYTAYGNINGYINMAVEIYGETTNNSITINSITYRFCLVSHILYPYTNNNFNNIRVCINGIPIGEPVSVSHPYEKYSYGNVGNYVAALGWQPYNSTEYPYSMGGIWYEKTFNINQTLVGLDPITSYKLSSIQGTADIYDSGIFQLVTCSIVTQNNTNYQYTYTDGTVPVMYFSNIKDKSVVVGWVDNNPPSAYDLGYKLERRTKGGTYVLVRDFANSKIFEDTDLTPDTEYEYKLTMRYGHPDYHGSHSHYLYAYGSVTTATDPAVAAALEAASKADAAKQSAELAKASADNASEKSNLAYSMAQQAKENTWDSSESKSAATLAKEARDKANDALAAVNNIQTILSENFSVITSLKLQGLNGATVTRNNSFSIIATSKQGVTYTAICNGPSNPVISISDNIITLNNISVPGAYTVTVTAVSGSASLQESITFFKI